MGFGGTGGERNAVSRFHFVLWSGWPGAISEVVQLGAPAKRGDGLVECGVAANQQVKNVISGANSGVEGTFHACCTTLLAPSHVAPLGHTAFACSWGLADLESPSFPAHMPGRASFRSSPIRGMPMLNSGGKDCLIVCRYEKVCAKGAEILVSYLPVHSPFGHRGHAAYQHQHQYQRMQRRSSQRQMRCICIPTDSGEEKAMQASHVGGD